MFVQPNNPTQTQLDRIDRELTTLQERRVMLEGWQTRFYLLSQFQKQGVTRPYFRNFKQAGHRLL